MNAKAQEEKDDVPQCAGHPKPHQFVSKPHLRNSTPWKMRATTSLISLSGKTHGASSLQVQSKQRLRKLWPLQSNSAESCRVFLLDRLSKSFPHQNVQCAFRQGAVGFPAIVLPRCTWAMLCAKLILVQDRAPVPRPVMNNRQFIILSVGSSKTGQAPSDILFWHYKKICVVYICRVYNGLRRLARV